MNKELRRPLIAGNWKMNKTPKETMALLGEITALPKGDCQTLVCVPFTGLETALNLTEDTGIAVGAQNCHWQQSGAFTGEVSPCMLSELGVQYVILGHSERRAYFGETDRTVNARLKAALDAGLTAIVCVGETEEQRELGITEEVVSIQLKGALLGIDAPQMEQVVIAYEPVWAIGTGKTATPQQANEVCCYIRWVIEELYDNFVAGSTQILYGGSMNGENAKELLAMDDIDGGLVGGAALKAQEFGRIIEATLSE